MTDRIQAVKGTVDLLLGTGDAALAVREILAAPARAAGYGYVETPVFEFTELFARGVGETTDVVSKEMFTFPDRGGRSITLRPEGTVGVVRAVLESGLDRGPLPIKAWYVGPMFRYEQPQAGRQRQFVQVGAEALGSDDPALDAELIWLADRAFRSAGLTRTELLLNSLGDPADRAAYGERLRSWLTERVGGLDTETDRRIALNPLRVLDDKRPEVRERTAGAPLLAEALSPQALAHHDAVRRHLDALGVAYIEDPRLVRGLDYYRRTTFEFVHPLLGAQSTIGAGGRYDGLSEAIGGPPLPGIGWALGVERTLLALAAEEVAVPGRPVVEVFGVPIGPAAKDVLVTLVARLREAGIRADLAYGDRGLKGAMKAADRSGAAYAVVVGDRNLEAGTAEIKHLASGEQETVELAVLVAALVARLGNSS